MLAFTRASKHASPSVLHTPIRTLAYAATKQPAPTPPKFHTPSKVEHAPFLLEELPEYSNAEQLAKLPQFTISRARGFLPREDPLVDMPSSFKTLDSLLKRMTIRQRDGSEGLLALGQFGDAVNAELKMDGPEMKLIEQSIKEGNTKLLSALFRDYCFLASAYLMEPIDVSYRKTGFYVPGRNKLPAPIAVPLTQLADALGHFPFMEYASSYALVNYYLKQPTFEGKEGEFSFDNLELVRAFQDHDGSEKGFILTHICMVRWSGAVVSATEDALRAAESGDVKMFEKNLADLLAAYRKIQTSMKQMWARSSPADYMKFRSFIYGTGPKLGNPLFPEGVIYEGTRFGDVPQYARGESGANDSLIPTLDNLLEVTARFPKNELTEALKDFRSYRPANQRDYLTLLEARAKAAGVKNFANERSGSIKAKALYILLSSQIVEFRNRHWDFAKAYILRRTAYPMATGGTPMISYLPHNLDTSLRVLEESLAAWTDADDAALRSTGSAADVELAADVCVVGLKTSSQRAMLEREVEQIRAQKQTDSSGGMLPQQSPEKGAHEDRAPKRGAVGCDGVG